MNGGPMLVADAGNAPRLTLACLSRRLRNHIFALLVLAPIPGLAAALLAIGGAPLVFDQPQFHITLALDVPGALLLGVAALLWIAGGVYAFTDLRGKANSGRFAVCWLLTLAGSLGVFIAADLLGFYLVFALVSLPAYGLIAHDEDGAAGRASGVYMAFTVLSEAFLLIGFVLLAAGEPNGSLQISDVVAALPQSPWRDAALVLTIAGFALKIAIVPVTWLDAADLYGGADSGRGGTERRRRQGGRHRTHPLSALRSRVARLGRNAWRRSGCFSAFYGVAIGITQTNPKTVLAYSSISQMGVIAAVLGMGLAAGDKGTALDAAFYAAHHVLVKGALFMAIGVVAVTSAHRRRWTLILAAVLALSLGGSPSDRRRAGEARREGAARRWHGGHARNRFSGGHDPSHAAFPAASCIDGFARPGGRHASRVCPVLAIHGGRFRPGSLAAVPPCGWPCR